MKILVYECKKILNIKLFIVLGLFTILFYDLFMEIVGHPYENAECQAEVDLSTVLREEYGYDTYLPYEKYAVLEEIQKEQVAKLDAMIEQSSVLRQEGITTFEQLNGLSFEEMSEAVSEERIRITFDEGIREVFLKQEIEKIYEYMEVTPVMGVERGKEKDVANTFLWIKSSHGDYSDEAVQRVANVIKENSLSLMSTSVMVHLKSDLQRFGILLVISCFLFILPYQIRERLAGVNTLMATTHTGRGLWNKRYISAVISCIGICMVQFLGFCVVLERAEALQYWEYPVNGTIMDMFWFDMNFGTYLLVNMILYTIVAIGAMTIFYFISRLSVNYIAGVALGIPILVILGILSCQFTNAFLEVNRSIFHDVLRPIIYVMILFVIVAVILYGLHRWDKRRDIFL